jgi:hypothetical protein
MDCRKWKLGTLPRSAQAFQLSLTMIEDLIHGPRSSAERAEKLGQFGPGMAPPVRFALFFSKLKAQQRKVRGIRLHL